MGQPIAIAFRYRILGLMERTMESMLINEWSSEYVGQNINCLWVSHTGVIETAAQNPAATPLLGHADILRLMWHISIEPKPSMHIICSDVLRCPVRTTS